MDNKTSLRASRGLRGISQGVFFYIMFPLFLPLFFCPYRFPWIMCDTCSIFSCPSKYLRNYILFFIGGFALLAGRAFCSWSCPFGSIQDMMNFASRKFSGTRNLEVRNHPWIKYALLLVSLVIVVDVLGYINLGFAIPSVLVYAPIVFFIALSLSIFVSRFWCRFLCPLGAIISTANKFSFLRLKIKRESCTECGICKKNCLMMNENEKHVNINSTDCILCIKCLEKCPKKAVKIGLRGNL
jgi:polyferredoxin